MAGMETDLPTIEQVRAALAPLTLKQLDVLEELSGVPATTIYKIKRGETANPGLETVRQFVQHIEQAASA
jgi:predicted transcriptional regulator